VLIQTESYSESYNKLCIGFLKDIEIETTILSNAKLCQDLMLTNKVDLTIAAEGPISYAFRYKPSFKILAFGGSNPEIAMFSRISSGITNSCDLKNKKIAYLPGTVSFFYLARLLDECNILKSEVDLLPMQSTIMLPALKSKSIDAFVMWEPWGIQAKTALVQDYLEYRRNDLYEYKIIYLAHLNAIQNKLEQIKLFLDAIEKAHLFIKSSPNESIEIFADKFKMDKAFLKDNFKNYKFNFEQPETTIKQIKQNENYLHQYDPQFKHNENIDQYIMRLK
jgi:ABC-type nitrate/sulfonate/bicarbonate transport system substrate-binding protein